MSYPSKRLYVHQANGTYHVSEGLSDLSVMGKDIPIGVYALVSQGTLRCDPTLVGMYPVAQEPMSNLS